MKTAILVIEALIASKKARMAKAYQWSGNLAVSYVETSLLEAEIEALTYSRERALDEYTRLDK